VTLTELFTYINTAGVVGLLALGVWLGFRGEIIPAKQLERIVRITVIEILDELQERGMLPPN
jgi:hypothetical protein